LVAGSLTALGLAIAAVALVAIEPAVPTIDSDGHFFGTVVRGELVREVRGPGTLVPEEIRQISVSTEGTVERVVILPGQPVTRDTVILELSNPQLEQATRDAELELAAARAEYADLVVSLERELLTEQAATKRVESDSRQATLQARADQELFAQELIAELHFRLSEVRAEELAGRAEIERRRLAAAGASVEARLRSKRARLEQTEALSELREQQLAALDVKAGIDGVLQQVPVEVGARIPAGGTLAVVARPHPLQARIRVPESQVREITAGQIARIDTRNGIADGRVVRIDPAVRDGAVRVDVAITGALPAGSRPDLSVDATIEIERVSDVLFVDRPAYGHEHSRTTVFRLSPDGKFADRVPVTFGRTSVRTIEIVEGLEVGDRVVLSDTSRYQGHDRIRLK
jgi:HlyD family secretion protein